MLFLLHEIFKCGGFYTLEIILIVGLVCWVHFFLLKFMKLLSGKIHIVNKIIN